MNASKRILLACALVGLTLVVGAGAADAAVVTLDVDSRGGLDVGCSSGEPCRVDQDVLIFCLCSDPES